MKQEGVRQKADPTHGEPPVRRFHEILVESIRAAKPAYLSSPFTVAEIYQSLVPYRTHRDRLGIEMNGDYEVILMRLLAGEGDLLLLQSEPARERIRKELESRNPNTGIYREFAAAEVRLNPARLSEGLKADSQRQPEGPVSSNREAAPPDVEGNGHIASQRAEARERSGGEAALTCPECGEKLPGRDNLQFCPFCGANTHVVPCRNCGEILERSWRFCIACGTPAKV